MYAQTMVCRKYRYQEYIVGVPVTSPNARSILHDFITRYEEVPVPFPFGGHHITYHNHH